MKNRGHLQAQKHPMEKTVVQKEEDLLSTLSILEQYYNRDSPLYKFQHTFYNIQSVSDLACVPVLVRGHDELNTRIAQQNATAVRLDEACRALEMQLNHVVAKAEILREKVNECVREIRQLYSMRGDLDGVFKLKRKMLFRTRDTIGVKKDKKTEVLRILEYFRSVLLKLREDVERR